MLTMLWLSACGGGGAYDSTGDAPFKLAGDNALFAPSSADSGVGAVGVLLLSNGAATCADLSDAAPVDLMQGRLDVAGAELVFSTIDPSGSVDDAADYTGSYTILGNSDGSATRSLVIYGVDDDGTVSVDVDADAIATVLTADDSSFTGSFSSDWWSGDFDAEPCVPFEADADTDADSDSDADSDTDTDSDADTDFDPRTDIIVDWDPVDSGGHVSVEVVNSGAAGWYLGLAETAAGDGGWYGEDCADNLCHTSTQTSATIAYTESVSQVGNARTLFDGGNDGLGDAFHTNGSDRLTYLLQLSGGPLDGDCYIWGDDPSYYAGQGCQAL
jgi:hypothetical protein